MEMNFEELDLMVKFNYREDLFKRVSTLEYDTISGCVYGLYFTIKQSAREVAEKLGVTTPTVVYWLKKWGFDRRSQGGNVKNQSLKDPAFIQKIVLMDGVVSSQEVARKTGVASSTIRAIWKRNRSN